MAYLLKNAMLFQDGQFRPADLSIAEGRIASIARHLPGRSGPTRSRSRCPGGRGSGRRSRRRFKMNPPLRAASDRAALLQGLLDGTIDMVATDHAPHSAQEKSRGLFDTI